MTEQDSVRLLAELLLEMESLLQLPAVQLELSGRGVDPSVLLASLDGLAAYLDGDKAVAVENLVNAADAVVAQLEASGAQGWSRDG